MDPETLKPILDGVAPIIIMVVVWLVNQIHGKMPQFLAPIFATALGPLAAWLNSLAVDGDVNWTVAWLAGLAAIGIHQHAKKAPRAFAALADGRPQPKVGMSGRPR